MHVAYFDFRAARVSRVCSLPYTGRVREYLMETQNNVILRVINMIFELCSFCAIHILTDGLVE